MRNRVTTEYKEVEKDSSEYWALRAELHADGRPRWEQTGELDLAAYKARVEANQLRAEDVGDADQPVAKSFGIADPNPVQLDRGYPTPGEIEQEAGRAVGFDDEQAQREGAVAGGDISTGYPAGYPPEATLPDEAKSATLEPSQEKLASLQGNSSSSDDSYASKGVDDLEQLVSDRGLSDKVEGTGANGNVVKADLVKVLEDNDSENDA